MEILQEQLVPSGPQLHDSPGGSEACKVLSLFRTEVDTVVVAIVHPRALVRESISRSLENHNPALAIASIGSLQELRSETAVVVMMLGSRSPSDPLVQAELKELASRFCDTSVIVVADEDGPAHILAALDAGARGYVPTSATVNVLAQAIALARCGGSFVPASCILSLKDAIRANDKSSQPHFGALTNRQAAVANALREGKANKIIAYELNMCEATVKVHVREIMKKLKATNRTEAAYRLFETRMS